MRRRTSNYVVRDLHFLTESNVWVGHSETQIDVLGESQGHTQRWHDVGSGCDQQGMFIYIDLQHGIEERLSIFPVLVT